MIHSICDDISAAKCNGLPFFHKFTGCDQGNLEKPRWCNGKLCFMFQLFFWPIAERSIPYYWKMHHSFIRSMKSPGIRQWLSNLQQKLDRWKPFHQQRMMLSFNTQNVLYTKQVVGDNPLLHNKIFLTQMHGVGIKKKMVDFWSTELQFLKLPLYVANSFAVGVTQKKDVNGVENAKNLHWNVLLFANVRTIAMT